MEWIQIVSGVPQVSVLILNNIILFIIYTCEMFELVENLLFAYADDSILLAIVHKPAARSAIATSLDRDLARIQEWCMILNPNKIKGLVVS